MWLLSKIIYSFVLMSSIIYCWHKVTFKKINFKNHKLYVALVLLMFISVLNYFNVNEYIRIVIITLFLIIFFYYLFKADLIKTIITPIFIQMIYMLSEMIFAIIFTAVLKVNTQVFIESYFGLIITNLFIAIIAVLLVQIPFILKFYKKVLKITKGISLFQVIILCLILMISSNILSMIIYYKIDYQYLLIFNTAITLIFGFIILNSIKTQNKYNKVYDKYNIAIHSLRDYEEMMSNYRIANHENKNLLLTIRAMILNCDKDIATYIDSIIEEKYKDDEKLLFEMNIIPTGGLRATIYSGILKIKNNKIKYSLNIDKRISTIDMIELDKDTIIDICKIVGVFIDNAIEETKSLKNKRIQISMYLENERLNIKVTNNLKSSIDLQKIYEIGYTTKGKNHGFGLSLVKNIILSNNLLENNVEINKKMFSQILIIKYKK